MGGGSQAGCNVCRGSSERTNDLGNDSDVDVFSCVAQEVFVATSLCSMKGKSHESVRRRGIRA